MELTLRQHYAGLAMQALSPVSLSEKFKPGKMKRVAKSAYQLADLMVGQDAQETSEQKK